MSLINEALKKAQAQEHGKHAPAAMTPSAVASSGVSPAVIVGALVVVAALGAAGYFVFASKDEPAVKSTVAEAPKVEAPTAVKAAVEISKVAEIPKEVEAPKPVETPKVVEPVTITQVTPLKPVDATPEPKRNEAVVLLIDAMNVSLGRKSNQRAVIDGRVRQSGDELCGNPQILLETVDDTTLTFVDANGVRYIKRYK